MYTRPVVFSLLMCLNFDVLLIRFRFIVDLV